ncbi:MAG: hypothetical protein ACOX4R_04325 [Lentihominibacter sp.]|jgi:hypothetical protein
MNNTEIIATQLKKIIDKNGFQYLEDHAYQIYELVKEEKLLDDMHARVLLICLLSADYKNFNRNELEKETLSSSIQKNCALRKKVSDHMADAFIKLFDEKNCSAWEEKQYSGFKRFCKEEWTFAWEGFCVWYVQDVQMDCSATASAVVRIRDSSKVQFDNEKLLKENPFVTSEQIFEIYKNQLLEELNAEFHYYCTCDDYYPPVVEDYFENYKYLVEEFCEKHGLELIDCDYKGESSNYY